MTRPKVVRTRARGRTRNLRHHPRNSFFFGDNIVRGWLLRVARRIKRVGR